MRTTRLLPGGTAGRPTPSVLGIGSIALSFALAGCGAGSPTAPTPGALMIPGGDHDSATSGALDDSYFGAQFSAQQASNRAPQLVLRTQPPAAPGSPYPEIRGVAPLEITFNLCASSDADQPAGASPGEGDSLNWQFHFGDDGTEPFNADGSFNANSARFCRASHTYQAGSYVATVSVTDKHLEDQARDVSSSARAVERISIIVSGGSSSSPVGFSSSSSLTTLFASNNSFAGNTFDLESSVPLQITGFDVNLDVAGGTHTIAVYYRPGTANGAQGSPAGWTLLGRDSGVVAAGLNSPSTVNVGGLTLTPGQTYGIYLEVESYPSAALQYTNGGPAAFSNADLSLTTYHGKGSPAFSGADFFPRQWNGTVRYVK